MRLLKALLLVVAAIVLCAVPGGAQTGDQFDVVAVLGPTTVVLRGPSGVHEYTVPADAKFGTSGGEVGVSGLKPGMKVTSSSLASIRGVPVTVHNELNASVVAKAGDSMLIRGARGVNRYSWRDAKDISVVRDGALISVADLNVGDRLTGMIVTKLSASKAAEAGSAAAAAPPAPAAQPAAPAPAAQSQTAQAEVVEEVVEEVEEVRLPKTASPVPLFGLLGALSLAAGFGLTALRKSRPAK